MKQKLADFLNVFFGMRKFIAWFALFIVGIALRLHNYLDGSQFVDLIKTTFMGFVAGNSTEHIVSVVKEYVNSKGQTASSGTPPIASDNLVDSSADTTEADDAKVETGS